MSESISVFDEVLKWERGIYGFRQWLIFSRRNRVTAIELIDHSRGQRVMRWPWHDVRSHDFPKTFTKVPAMVRAIANFEDARGVTEYDDIAAWWEAQTS